MKRNFLAGITVAVAVMAACTTPTADDTLEKQAAERILRQNQVSAGLSGLESVTDAKAQLVKASGSLIGDFFAPVTAGIEAIVANVTHETNVSEFVTANTQAVKALVDTQLDLAKKNLIDNATTWAKDDNTEYVRTHQSGRKIRNVYGKNSDTDRALIPALASLTLDSDVHAVIFAEYPNSTEHEITPTFSDYMAAQNTAGN